jgi:hypothetical protein
LCISLSLSVPNANAWLLGVITFCYTYLEQV